MSEEPRTPEQVATEIRDAVEALNALLRGAAAAGYNVELEARRVEMMDVKERAAHVHLHGVYRRVEPEPKPRPEPPPKRQHGKS
ncbi:MAG TPA: hypothetical protein VF668_01425 [Pyrinomonadaceae bacterium]|jgi:hypothetical protein